MISSTKRLQEEANTISKIIGKKFNSEDVSVLMEIVSLISSLRDKYGLKSPTDESGILSILEDVLTTDNMDRLSMFIRNYPDLINEM